MKTQLLFVLFSVLVSNICFGDVIVGNFHYVSKCVKITNVDDYPDISLIGYTASSPFTDRDTYIVSSSQCLTRGYGYGSFNIFAVNKTYLKEKDISKINFGNDPNALPSNIAIQPNLGMVNDSIPIIDIQEYYKVAGFSETNVILYLWKKVTKYNNGKPDLIESFICDTEMPPLYQKITVGVNTSKRPSDIEVFPNPANKNIHLRVNDSFKGTVSVELINSSGKVLKSFSLGKSQQILDYDIPVANVAKGAYFVKVQMGKAVEYKMILIK